MLVRFFLLCVGHGLCDFPRQGQFLSDAKNQRARIAGVPWQWCLLAHCLIHAGWVFLVTRSLALAMSELVVHALTDYLKSEEVISFSSDQAIHYACKLLWAVLDNER